jgi:hypothetical protein
VTGFGKYFRKLGDCFSWATFLIVTQIAKFWAAFSQIKLFINIDTNVLGYTLGDFFHQSSGRTAAEERHRKCRGGHFPEKSIFCINSGGKERKKNRGEKVLSQKSGSVALPPFFCQGCQIYS